MHRWYIPFLENKMNFSRHFYAVAGILAILTALSAGSGRVSSSRVVDKPLPVAVTNTSANPVPISGTVSITSTNANPIIVKDSGRTPFFYAFEVSFSQGSRSGTGNGTYTVPAGKTLVLTGEAVYASMVPGQNLVSVDLRGFNTALPLDFKHYGYNGTAEVWSGRSTGDVYIPAGSFISPAAFRDSLDSSGIVFVEMFGYLVDAPQTA